MKLLFLFLIIISIKKSSQQDCKGSYSRRMDEVMAKLLTIGNSGRVFPETKGEDLKKYCEETKDYIQQIEIYKNKCLKDLPKQVTGVIVYSIKNTLHQLCKKETKRLNQILSATPCTNKASNEINKCYTRYIDGLLGAKHAPDDKKIPHNCCEYFKIFSCSETRMKKINGCNEEQIDISLDFIKSLFGNVVDLICGDYTENSNKCDTLEEVPKKKKNQRRTKSFLIPFIDLLSSFKEVE